MKNFFKKIIYDKDNDLRMIWCYLMSIPVILYLAILTGAYRIQIKGLKFLKRDLNSDYPYHYYK